MSVISSYGTRRFTTDSDDDVVIVNRLHKADGQTPGIIYCHGSGANGKQLVNDDLPGTYPLMRALAERFPVLGCNFQSGAASNWGNDLSIARISQAIIYFQSTWGARTGKVFLVGQSMGNQTALCWAAQNLSQVAAVVSWIPVSDMNDMYVNDRGGLRTGGIGTIDYAYGGPGGWVQAEQQAEHDPNYMAGIGKFAGLPCRFYYASDDTIVIPSTVTTLATKIGSTATAIDLGTGGHSEKTIKKIVPADVIAFMDAHSAQ